MVSPQYSENRKERRYILRLPVRLAVKGGGSGFDAVSENISAHGVLLLAAKQVRKGTNVTLSVTVSSVSKPRHLTARGTVVRVVQLDSQNYALAVHCNERPFLIKKLGSSNLS